MSELFNIFKEIISRKNEDRMRIGLSQFKTPVTLDETLKKEVSIRNKEVKLSDLMRRTNTY